MIYFDDLNMQAKDTIKINSIVHLYESIPAEERLIVDMLRQIVRENIPEYCKEKISYNVPLFYGRRSICIIWPASIPRGGIKRGVLLGFWYGNRINDGDHYLTHGTNKQVFYKIFLSPEDIDENAIIKLLKEAIYLDEQKSASRKRR